MAKGLRLTSFISSIQQSLDFLGVWRALLDLGSFSGVSVLNEGETYSVSTEDRLGNTDADLDILKPRLLNSSLPGGLNACKGVSVSKLFVAVCFS